jgi:hypothetical protein
MFTRCSFPIRDSPKCYPYAIEKIDTTLESP